MKSGRHAALHVLFHNGRLPNHELQMKMQESGNGCRARTAWCASYSRTHQPQPLPLAIRALASYVGAKVWRRRACQKDIFGSWLALHSSTSSSWSSSSSPDCCLRSRCCHLLPAILTRKLRTLLLTTRASPFACLDLTQVYL
jgi:hypothetical protein